MIPIQANNSPAPVTTTVNPPPMSDLSITMSGTPDPVDAGSNLTYTIKATNSGPSTDPDAVVTDTLPANVTFVIGHRRGDSVGRCVDAAPGQPGRECDRHASPSS